MTSTGTEIVLSSAFFWREIHPDVCARNNQMTNHLRMISRHDQTNIATVTVAHYVNGAETELLDNRSRVVGHHRTRAVAWRDSPVALAVRC
jgi:hypothetical protein